MTQEQKDAYMAQQRASSNMSAAERKAASEAQGYVGAGARTGLIGAAGTTPVQVPVETPSVPRNLDAEAATVKQLGTVPQTEAEKAEMVLATYGDNIPTEFQDLMDRYNSLQGTTNQAAFSQFGQDLTAAGQEAAAFQGAVDEQAGQIPGELGILQEALRLKSGVGNQPLGESDIFKQAGVGGYGALSSSLAAHGAEMDFKYTSFANMVNQAAKFQYGENAKYAAQAKSALDQFAILQDSFRYEQGRLDDIAARAEAVQNELYIYGEKLKMDAAYEDAKNSSQSLGNSTELTTEQAQQIFQIPGQSRYREAGEWECGEGYNRITDGEKVGSDYSTKMSAVTKRDAPEVGNGLVLPLTAKGQGLTTGHVETVISIDNGLIQTVSWNRRGDGQQTLETYTIEELNDLYGENWGFTDSRLKPEYQQSLADMSGESTDKYSYTSFYQQAIADGQSPESAAAFADKQYAASQSFSTIDQANKYYQYAKMIPEEMTYAKVTADMTDAELEAYAENNGYFVKKLQQYDPDDVLTAQIVNELFTTPEERQLFLAQARWVGGKLRGESGAAISIGEYLNEGQQFWPQKGDDAAMIKEKEKARENILDSLYNISGLHGQKLIDEMMSQQETEPQEEEDPLVSEYKSAEVANDPDYEEAKKSWDGVPADAPSDWETYVKNLQSKLGQ